MPFGPAGALAAWQAVMDEVFADPKWKHATMVYFDDIYIYTYMIDEHLDVLDQSLSVLGTYGFKIETNKCQFLQTQIKFLTYLVSHGGKLPDPGRSAAVDKYPNAFNTVKPLRSFSVWHPTFESS